MSKVKRKCDNCGKEYFADTRNLKRGWGLCCSKSCAAKKREMSKPGYNPETVRYNNLKRAGLLPRELPHAPGNTSGNGRYYSDICYEPEGWDDHKYSF
ncbi:MAG: hypothetical protein R3243_16960 [Arenibacter latericius]|nr:hypothetical protein [Arenibacter latericius]